MRSFWTILPKPLRRTTQLALAVSAIALLLPSGASSLSFCTTPAIATQPTASFSVNPSSGSTGTSFSFDGSASTGAVGTYTPGACVHTQLPINGYVWSFGDGSSGISGATASHKYTTAGTFTVTLTVESGGAYQGTTYPDVSASTTKTVAITGSSSGGSTGGNTGGGTTGGNTNTGATGSQGLTLGHTVSVTPVSGQVLVKVPGQGFVPLASTSQVPNGSEVDAQRGSLTLTAATASSNNTQSGTFAGAVFHVTQAAGGKNKGLTTLALDEGGAAGAPSYASCRMHSGLEPGGPAASAAVSSRTLQTLRARGHGSFSTRGRYGSATARGTAWTISDRCNGTLIAVQKDTVVVRDFVHHKTITLRAGQRYLAKR